MGLKRALALFRFKLIHLPNSRKNFNTIHCQNRVLSLLTNRDLLSDLLHLFK